MNITNYLKFTFCFFIIIFLSSCGKKESKEQKIVEVKKIIFLTKFSGPTIISVFDKVIDEFMKKNPDIKVKALYVSHQHYIEKLTAMSAGGTLSDVIFIGSELIPSLCSKGLFRELDSFLEKDKELRINDFYPSTIESYKHKSKLYALPNDIAVNAIYYNKNIFDKEKVPYPKKGWDWKDLLEISKKLTRDTDGDGRIDQYALSEYAWILFVLMNNGQIVDDLDNPTKCTINSPECVEALQFFSDLRHIYHVMPSYENLLQQGSSRELFPTGKIAMSIDGVWMIPSHSKIKNFKWDISPLPKGKKYVNFAGGSGYAISSVSKNPEEAWKFIKFMAGTEGQKLLVSAGFNTPCLKSKKIERAFLSEPKGINKKPFLDAIKYGIKTPSTPKFAEINRILNRELDKIWIGKEKDVKKICDRIVVEVNKILQEK